MRKPIAMLLNMSFWYIMDVIVIVFAVQILNHDGKNHGYAAYIGATLLITILSLFPLVWVNEQIDNSEMKD